MIAQTTIRISSRAKPFPAQLAGPNENGKNAAELCTSLLPAMLFSPVAAKIHRSGQNMSGLGEKFRGSRWMLNMCTVTAVPSGK